LWIARLHGEAGKCRGGGPTNRLLLGDARALAEPMKPLSAYSLRSDFDELADEAHIRSSPELFITAPPQARHG
jgi:hypothetical protein